MNSHVMRICLAATLLAALTTSAAGGMTAYSMLTDDADPDAFRSVAEGAWFWGNYPLDRGRTPRVGGRGTRG